MDVNSVKENLSNGQDYSTKKWVIVIGTLYSLPVVILSNNTPFLLLMELGFVQEVNGEPLTAEEQALP